MAPAVHQIKRDTGWSIANETAGLIAVTLSFTLLGVKLQPAGYGAFLGLTAVVGPLAAFASGGVFLTLLEFISTREDTALVGTRSCITLALTIGGISSMLASAIVLLSVPGLAWLTVVLLCTNDLVLGSLFFTLAGLLQIEFGFVTAARARISMHLSRSAMLLTLLATDHLRLLPYALAQMTLLTVVCTVLTIKAQRHLGGSLYFGRFRWKHLHSTFLYAIGLSALGVQNDGDKFALNRAGYAADAGRYGFGYRLVQLGLLPITALAGSTHVSFLDGSDNRRPLDRARRLGAIAGAYALVAMLGLWVMAPVAENLLSKQFADTATIIRWLSPLVLLRGLGVFALNGLLGLGKNKLRTRILLTSAAVSVVAYALLVPTHSWRGAALGTLISEVTLCSLGWATLLVQQRKADRTHHGYGEELDVVDEQISLDTVEGGEIW